MLLLEGQNNFLPAISFPKGLYQKSNLGISSLGDTCKDVRLEKPSEENTNVQIPAELVSPADGWKPQYINFTEFEKAAGSE